MEKTNEIKKRVKVTVTKHYATYTNVNTISNDSNRAFFVQIYNVLKKEDVYEKEIMNEDKDMYYERNDKEREVLNELESNCYYFIYEQIEKDIGIKLSEFVDVYINENDIEKTGDRTYYTAIVDITLDVTEIQLKLLEEKGEING